MLKIFLIVLSAIAAVAALIYLVNRVSYSLMKRRVLNQRTWGLNICCGKTDGGGINVDIVRHTELPNLHIVDDIYHLPFETGQFEHVLCSHTIEHIEDPALFDRELRRVGGSILYIVPPLWDLAAAFNIVEHRWLFLTLSKEHGSLPKYIRLPFADLFHELIGGQKIRA